MTVKTKKRICITVGLLALLLTLGIVGGMEWGDIPVGRGAALALFCEALWACAWWKAGVIRFER